MRARTKLLLPPKGAKDSAPLRDHLIAAARQTGRCDPRLDEPELPTGFEPAWRAFWSMYAGSVLTFAEIDAYARLTGEEPSPREAELLRTMSVAAVKEAQSG